jgi:hypothetical protein
MHECLVDALVAAKVAFAPVLKTRSAKIKSGKGDFGYKYASLEDVIEAVEGALTANGIVQVQRMAVRDGHQLLVTELRWKGEVLSSEMILPLEGLDPQGCGRVISYFRRYTLQALLGITAEDDDAADTQHVRQPAAKHAPEPEPDRTTSSSTARHCSRRQSRPRARTSWPRSRAGPGRVARAQARQRHARGRAAAAHQGRAETFGLDLASV